MTTILDFSPKHENTENIQMALYKFTNGNDFARIVNKLRKRGYAFPGEPKIAVDYFFVKKHNPRCFFIKSDFNSLTGKKEITVTCKAWLKSYPQYKGINIDKLVKEI